jgi:acetolactate synthase-1/2/3 large subunit
VTAQILEAVREELQRPAAAAPDLSEWWAQLRSWTQQHPLRADQPAEGPLKPQTVVRAMGERLASMDAVVVTGVGQHQMWASQHIRYERPRTWINSGGLGTMGFCVPAAIGAKVGRPDATVVAIDGDGSFQMTLQELATARTERIPVIFCVINNGALGMVRQWQELFYNQRYSQIDLSYDCPDLVKLAEAYGCAGFRCDRPEDVESTLDKALGVGEVPVVVDFRVDQTEKVFPMVPAGGSNDNVIESADDWYEQAAAGAVESAPAAACSGYLRQGGEGVMAVVNWHETRRIGTWKRRDYLTSSVAIT